MAIEISDNGRGISDDIESAVNGRNEGAEIVGIGMSNAIHRIRMYYGSDAVIKAKRKSPGTTVYLELPLVEDDRTNENCHN